MDLFNNKTILITGGTGSFGRTFVRYLMKNHKPKKVIVFSRDEFKQFKMQSEIPDPNMKLRFFLGDVRDLGRLQMAFQGVDIVIHAAALKQIPIIEYNPTEAIKTNITGSQNVIEAAIYQKVSKVLLISSDKAVQPINLYGATKLSAEKLFVAANAYSPNKTIFSVVRYGNVVASRGSIIETLLAQKGNVTQVKITDPEMTRFWLTLKQSCQLVTFATEHMTGGEIFIPRIPSMKIDHLFKAIAPNAKREIIGLRPGEKMHEILITEHESKNTYALGSYFVVLPEIKSGDGDYTKYYKKWEKMGKDFQFTSNTNTIWLTDKDIKKIIANKEII